MKRRRVEKFNLRADAEVTDRVLRPRKINPRWFSHLLPNSPISATKNTHKTPNTAAGGRKPSLRSVCSRYASSQRCMQNSVLSAPATPPRSNNSKSLSSVSFTSCLITRSCASPLPTTPSSPRSSITLLLKRAVSLDALADDSWLTSSLVDLVLARFATSYPSVSYLSIDFAALASNTRSVTDILGHPIEAARLLRPLIFLCNNSNMHWTLIRVLPSNELQLFEPMGKPLTRNGALSYRYVPRNVVQWLDNMYPLDDGRSWLAVTTSAITEQHQVTSFDCGVACLLYAEKCGLGEDKHTINNNTSQNDITEYRKTLQQFVQNIKSS